MLTRLFIILLLQVFVLQTFATEAKLPESHVLPASAFIATWDGQVIISPKPIAGNLYKWEVRTLRSKQLNLENLHNNQTGGIFSPPKILDSDDEDFGSGNVLKAKKRMHIAVYKDQDYSLNPYPSSASGQQQLDGKYLTYRIGIVGVAKQSLDYSRPDGKNMFLISKGMVVVGNPYTDQSYIAQSKLLQKGEPLRIIGSNEVISGLEPSLSLDGRLMIFNGHPINGRIGYVMYSYNPTPHKASGWTQPRPINEMYFVHGAGSNQELRVDGIRFSEKYPIAQKPFRSDSGEIFGLGDAIHGAYPWLSFDASEFFSTSVQTFYGPTRSAVVGGGRLTNWMVRHLDGPMNPSRANVTNKSTNWLATAEGAALRDAYDNAFGKHRWQRILLTPLGLSNSMWLPQNTNIPLYGQDHTYSFLLSHSKNYVEVPMGEVVDGNYAVYFPMNEALKYDMQATHRDLKNKRKIWEDLYSSVQHDPDRTPDVSGNFAKARLTNGAEFYFERMNAKEQWAKNQIIEDKTNGAVGNSIYFKQGSHLDIDLNDNVVQKLKNAKKITVAFWLYRDEKLRKFSSVLKVKNAFEVRHMMQHYYFLIDGYIYRSYIPNDTPGQWNHIALAADLENDKVAMYLNGEFQRYLPKVESKFRLDDISSEMTVGPYNYSPEDVDFYQLDEVNVSDVLRTPEEIAKMAHIQKPSTSISLSQKKEVLDLGRQLFFDKNLSSNRKVSCASCHNPKFFYTDTLRTAIGVSGRSLKRNTPTVLNTNNHMQMWDGRAQDLVEQALMPLFNADEMGMSESSLLPRIQTYSYKSAFQKAYGNSPNLSDLAHALASYQASLVSQDSQFDNKQLNEVQLQGWGVFTGKARCTSCHTGVNFTDNQLHNVGLSSNEQNAGRYDVTGRSTDFGKFKTPTLRNVAETAPYFHDGQKNTLDEVIEHYNKGGDSTQNRDVHLQPLGLTPYEKNALKEFLKTLTSKTIPE